LDNAHENRQASGVYSHAGVTKQPERTHQRDSKGAAMAKVYAFAAILLIVCVAARAAEPATQPARMMQITVLAAETKTPIEKATLSILIRGGGKDQKLTTDVEGKAVANLPICAAFRPCSAESFESRAAARGWRVHCRGAA